MADRLTTRQEQVAHLIAQHRSTPEIAAELGLSESTVKLHIRNLKDFLGVSHKRDIPAAARQYGIDR